MKCGKFLGRVFIVLSGISLLTIDISRKQFIGDISIFVILETLTFLNAFLLLGFYVYDILRKSDRSSATRKLVWIQILGIGLFPTYSLLSLANTPSVAGVQNLTIISLFFFVPLPLAHFLRGVDSQKLMDGIPLFAIAVTTYFLLSRGSALPFIGDRAFGLGSVVLMAGTVANHKFKWSSFIAAVLLLSAAVISESRMAVAILIAFMLYACWFWGKTLMSRVKVLISSFTLIWILNFTYVFASSLSNSESAPVGNFPGSGFTQRLEYSGDNGVRIADISINTSGRIEAWQFLLSKVDGLDIFLGHGPGQSALALREQFGKTFNEPHNDYLRLFFDYGLAGILLSFIYLVALVIVGKNLWPNLNLTAMWASILAISGAAVLGLTDNPIICIFVVAPIACFIGLAFSGKSAGRDLLGTKQFHVT